MYYKVVNKTKSTVYGDMMLPLLFNDRDSVNCWRSLFLILLLYSLGEKPSLRITQFHTFGNQISKKWNWSPEHKGQFPLCMWYIVHNRENCSVISFVQKSMLSLAGQCFIVTWNNYVFSWINNSTAIYYVTQSCLVCSGVCGNNISISRTVVNTDFTGK